MRKGGGEGCRRSKAKISRQPSDVSLAGPSCACPNSAQSFGRSTPRRPRLCFYFRPCHVLFYREKRACFTLRSRFFSFCLAPPPQNGHMRSRESQVKEYQESQWNPIFPEQGGSDVKDVDDDNRLHPWDKKRGDERGDPTLIYAHSTVL